MAISTSPAGIARAEYNKQFSSDPLQLIAHLKSVDGSPLVVLPPDQETPLTKAAKGKNKGRGKVKKATDVAIHTCFTCGKSGAKLSSCSQCHRAYYCNRECQRKDWKRHKRACAAAVAAEPCSSPPLI